MFINDNTNKTVLKSLIGIFSRSDNNTTTMIMKSWFNALSDLYAGISPTFAARRSEAIFHDEINSADKAAKELNIEPYTTSSEQQTEVVCDLHTPLPNKCLSRGR